MKKKHYKYLSIYFFATYFLFAGTGYNVVSYCCNACADEGFEALATSSCFAIHHHTHTKQNPQQYDLTCNDLNHHSENCHLFRLNTDIPSFQSINQSYLKQFQILDLFISFSTFFSERTKLLVKNNISPPDIVVHKTGRTILTFHAILLI